MPSWVRAGAQEIRPPNSQPAGRLGEDLVIAGDRFTTAATTVRFTSSRLAQPIDVQPYIGPNPGELLLHLPSKAEDVTVLSRWAPGFFTVALVVKNTGLPAMVSNDVAFALAPRITVSPTGAAPGTVNLTITCEPRVAAGQRALLLFGDQQIEPDSITNPADTAQPTTLAFIAPGVHAGSYAVPLRMDGVDSIPVVIGGTPPFASFDPSQRVTVA